MCEYGVIDPRGIFVYCADLSFVLCEEENGRVCPTLIALVDEEGHLEKANVVEELDGENYRANVTVVEGVTIDEVADPVVHSLVKLIDYWHSLKKRIYFVSFVFVP